MGVILQKFLQVSLKEIKMKLCRYIMILLVLCNTSYSQYCNLATSNVSITPTTTSQLTASYSSGRRAFNFVATAGCVYEFSTCGQSTNDTYLRLYSTGTGGTLLTQNDNSCSTQSTLTWTATVNGTVSVLLTRSSCNALSVATKMSYRRIICNPPPCATLTTPINNSTGININQTLSWNSVSTATSYDVYFGTNSSPPLVTNQTTTTYNPGTLNYSTTYYWRVVAKNSNGSAVSCSTWSFMTKPIGCLTATYGQFPTSTYNPGCSGTAENITTTGYASEYSLVSLISNVTYTLSSSVSTDFITISDELGTTLFAYGTGSVVYNCITDGNYRFYTHTNEFCGSSTISRSRRIQCSTPPPPSNDLVTNAIDLGICGGVVNGNTKFATNVGDGPSCFTASGETWTAPGVWYKVKGNGKNVNVSLCGSSFDTKLFVYTGSPTNLTCLNYNDDFCSLQSELNFISTNDTIYHILVTGYGSSKGAFNLSVTLGASAPVITSQPQGDTICLGQSHTFSVTSTGVQTPLTYQWYLNNNLISGATSPTYSTNVAGNYYVIVSNSCSKTSQSNLVTLTTLSPPNLTTSVSDISCSGGGNGSIDLIVSGLGSPFSFNWVGPNGFTSTSEDITNLSTGIYTVTVTNYIGCQSTTTVEVTEPSSLVLTIVGSNALCTGQSSGSIDLTVSGGTPSYTYLWSNGSTNEDLTNLLPGNYVISVTDNSSCVATSSVTISNPVPFTISVNSPTISTCQNLPVQLTVTNGNTYLWSNGSTTSTISVLPTSTTVYTVESWNENNCYAVAQSTVTVDQTPPLLTIGNVYGPNQVYNYMVNGTIATYSVDPVVGATNYTWYIPNDGVFFTSSSNSNVITVQITPNFIGGDFYVIASNNCDSSYSDTLTVDILQDPIIVGSSCGTPLGSQITHYISNSLPGLTYVWTPPYGATIVTGQGNDTIKIKYSYTWFNSTSSSNLVASIITPYGTFTGSKQIIRNPSSPIAINGPTSVCADNSTIYEYYVDSVSNATGYIWGLPATVILVDGQLNDTIHVKFNTTYLSGNFNVQSLNQCGSSPMRYGSVSNNNLYTNIGTIAGPGDLCPYLGSTTTYSVTSQSGVFTWSTPSGMTIQSGQGTNVINVLVSNSFSFGNISVTLNNGCGGSISTNKSLSTTQTTIAASQIQGPSSVCSLIGTNISATFSITPINGVNYNWVTPINSTIISGQGTNLVNVTFQTGFSGGNIQVTVTGGCGNPVTMTRSITLNLPNFNISGVNCTDNGYTNNYSVTAQTGALSYNWTVPGNAQITSGQGTNAISVFFPSNFETTSCVNNTCDSIRLTVQFSCGSVTKARKIGLLTVAPIVTGPTQACFPDTITLIATTSPRITSYIWNKPNGVSFIGPTNNVTVKAKINSTFLGGSFSVMGVNTCGSSPMRYFYVNKVCLSPTNFVGNNNEYIESQQKISDVNQILEDPEYIERLKKPFDFIVYPNPGKNILNLRIFRGDYEYYLVTLYNNIGNVVHRSLKEKEDSINISDLSPGVYIIKVTDKNMNDEYKQIVIL